MSPCSPVRLLPAAAALLGLLLAACAAPPLDPPPADSRALVSGVQARHRGPRTVTFTQDVVDHREGAPHPTSSMDEWMSSPGQLRIDVAGPPPQTVLYHPEGRTLVSAAGIREAPVINPAQVLMIDIFVQRPDAWLAAAEGVGVDTGVLSEQLWDGRPAWVLGAQPGQDDVSQLWVDARSWLPLRYIERRVDGQGGVHLTEGRASEYRDFDGVIFHTRFEFLADGEPMLTEVYRNIVIDPEIPPATFDPQVVAQRFVDG